MFGFQIIKKHQIIRNFVNIRIILYCINYIQLTLINHSCKIYIYT